MGIFDSLTNTDVQGIDGKHVFLSHPLDIAKAVATGTKGLQPAQIGVTNTIAPVTPDTVGTPSDNSATSGTTIANNPDDQTVAQPTVRKPGFLEALGHPGALNTKGDILALILAGGIGALAGGGQRTAAQGAASGGGAVERAIDSGIQNDQDRAQAQIAQGNAANQPIVQQQQAAENDAKIAAQTATADLKTSQVGVAQQNADTRQAGMGLNVAHLGLKVKTDEQGKPILDANGQQVLEPDETSPVTQKQRAQTQYVQAQTDAQAAVKHLKETQAKYQAFKTQSGSDPNSIQNQQILEKLHNARMQAQAALSHAASSAQNVGLARERLDFQEDKAYNPEPTSAERTKADLGKSAQLQISTMRGIINAHPEYFGPGQGRATRFQEWIGSQDPEAQRFLASREFFSEHAAAMFGSRAKYVMQGLENLNKPESNTAALLANLDQSEKTTKEFINAGTIHPKGGHAPANDQDQNPQSGKAVSLAMARGLPQNKGKSDEQIRQDIQAHGHKVID